MRLLRNQQGAVYAEFLIAFVPLFALTLGVAQYALIAQAQIIVRHSASAGARSAIVVLDDDPLNYADQPRLRLGLESVADAAGAFTDRQLLGAALAELTQGGPRTQLIRIAAYKPLLALAPGFAHIYSNSSDGSLRSAVGNGDVKNVLPGVTHIAAGAAVVFPRQKTPSGTTPGSDSRRSTGAASPLEYMDVFQGEAEVTVRVTLAYPCSVPIAAELMCDAWSELRETALKQNLWGETQRRVGGREEVVTLVREGRLAATTGLLQDLVYAVMPQALNEAPNTRYRMLWGEATMPIQWAEYPYKSEIDRFGPGTRGPSGPRN